MIWIHGPPHRVLNARGALSARRLLCARRLAVAQRLFSVGKVLLGPCGFSGCAHLLDSYFAIVYRKAEAIDAELLGKDAR